MEQNESAYSGTGLLVDIDSNLVNYNQWIVSSLRKYAALPIGPRGRVLDFGAGIGTLSKIFHQQTGVKPECLEIDDRQRQAIAASGHTAHAQLQAGSTYDLIFSSNVLEHIPDDVKALKELRPHLLDDGRLALYLPAFRALWTKMDDKVGHHRRYTKGDLEAKLREAGYQVTYSRYCDSVGFFLALAFKAVGGDSGEPSGASLRLFDRFLLPISKLSDLVFHKFFGKNLLVIARKC